MNLDRGKGIFTELLSVLREIWTRVCSATNRRYIFMGLGGLLLLLLVIIIISINPGRTRDPGSRVANPDPSTLHTLDGLFYPGEPDFAPGFLIEREPRHSWSIIDISPYWRNPENHELWVREIILAIDKIMEGIP